MLFDTFTLAAGAEETAEKETNNTLPEVEFFISFLKVYQKAAKD